MSAAPGDSRSHARMGTWACVLLAAAASVVGCGRSPRSQEPTELVPSAKEAPTLPRTRHGLDLDAWIVQARSGDRVERRTAAWALSEISEDAERLLPILEGLAKDADAGVRVAALESLLRLRAFPPGLGDRLLTAARGSDAEARAATHLERDLARRAVPELVTLLRGSRPGAFRAWLMDRIREGLPTDAPPEETWVPLVASQLPEASRDTTRAAVALLLVLPGGAREVLRVVGRGSFDVQGVLDAVAEVPEHAEPLAALAVTKLLDSGPTREAALLAVTALGRPSLPALKALEAREDFGEQPAEVQSIVRMVRTSIERRR